ncbi:MAG: DUF4097 family beta strand repeat-containing protein [candidate division Zixibacteria bacterium]|nr:DUF4097 family beta strand repeat-containing protein [candidate division Zixibacteria bacterium]
MFVRKTAIVFCLMILMTTISKADEFQFEYQKILPVKSGIKLKLEIPRGIIEIIPSNNNKLIVEAVKTVRASNRNEAEEVADHIEIKVDQDGDNVNVNTNFLRMLNRSSSFWKKFIGAGEDSYGDVNFKIAVPHKCDLAFSTMTGKIFISDHDGAVDITGGTLEELKIEYNRGPITINCENAEIDLQWVEGDVKIKSQMGKIDIKQLTGSINVKTSSSAVNIETEMSTDKNYYVETTSGTIYFSVPVFAAGYLEIETKAGEIKSDVPVSIKSISNNRMEGEFGGGGTKVSLTSLTGDVEVSQY